MKTLFSLIALLFITSCNQPEAPDHKTGSCPKNLVPVCGQPKMIKCPQGQVCPMVMPLPKTYGNLCELNLAGSKFISNGACETN